MNGEKMTPTEETTASLIAKLQEQLEASKAECLQWRNDAGIWHANFRGEQMKVAEIEIRADKAEALRDQYFAATSKAQDERDEQRARAEKAEWALGAEVERCLAEKRQGDIYWRQIDDARKKLGETKNESEGGRSLALCVLDIKGLADALDQDNRELRQRAEKAERDLAEYRHNYAEAWTQSQKLAADLVASDRMLVERTRERDEAREVLLDSQRLMLKCSRSIGANVGTPIETAILELKRERDEAREQLAKLEWAGFAGITLGESLIACPCCKAKKVEGNHRVECWFAKGKAAPKAQPLRNHRLDCPARTAEDVAWVDSRWQVNGCEFKLIDGPRPRPIGCEGCKCARPSEKEARGKAECVARVNDLLKSGRLVFGCDFGTKTATAFNVYAYACGADANAAKKPEPSRPEPKFKVGQRVLWGDSDLVHEINRREWSPIGKGVWLYGAVCRSGLMHEPDIKPAPKFAVGEWVTRKYRSALPGVEIERREWRSGITHPAGGWLYSWGSSGGCDWEDDLTAQTPQHKHDCAGCVFLGRLGEADLYYCQGPCDGQMAATVAVLFPGRARSITRREALFATKDHIEARRRAVARGLVKA